MAVTPLFAAAWRALICDLLGAGPWFQIAAFLVVAGILLAALRPFVRKFVTPVKTATNADMAIGRSAYLTETMDKLNAIVFSYVVPEIERRVGTADGLYAIAAINLLESGLADLCDRTVVVTAPMELRVRRIMQRDNITEQYARLRISAQKGDEYYRAKCDCELTNDRSLAFHLSVGFEEANRIICFTKQL